MLKKHLFIKTMGCQMNVYDSQQIQNRLAPMGYTLTDDLDGADIIIVNTCSVRDKAEQKAFSFLGRLQPLKQRRPDLIIGIGGCVAQQEGRRIFKRMPYVDLVFGTHAIGRLPHLVRRIIETRSRVVDVEISEFISEHDFTQGELPQADVSAFVTIMRGCDNHCTYCVVPHVRGTESSRSCADILGEIEHLVSKGVREVTLLGQNVNSYGRKEGLCRFDQLLARVDAIEGLRRIRFTTSHPKDLSVELINCFVGLEKLCQHIHLPVQSGSNSVLKRMNRGYTREEYLQKVAQLRAHCPQIAISSDIIVGFPGETEDDFEATLELIRRVRFDGLFAFIYSDRPHAPAVHFDSKLDEGTKKARLHEVLARQERYTLARHRALVGSVQEILVDGPSKRSLDETPAIAAQVNQSGPQWSGRTKGNKIIHFISDGDQAPENQGLTGQLMRIMIEKAMPHCLWGRPVGQRETPAAPGKGDRPNAA